MPTDHSLLKRQKNEEVEVEKMTGREVTKKLDYFCDSNESVLNRAIQKLEETGIFCYTNVGVQAVPDAVCRYAELQRREKKQKRREQVKHVDLSGNDIKILNEDVWNMEIKHSLEIFSIAKNNLTELNEGVICGLTRIRFLDVSGNKLAGIPDMDPLIFLETLDVSRNPLKVLPESVTSMKRLKVLKADECYLSELPEHMSRMINLRELFLRDNKIKVLKSCLFGLPRLELLDMSRNWIKTIEPGIDSLLLRELYLSLNKIEKLPELPYSLTVLDLDYNKMEWIGTAIPKLKALRKLILGHNLLRNIDGVWKCKFLQYMDVCENKLSQLPYELSDMEYLSTLILYGNEFEDMLLVAHLNRHPDQIRNLLRNQRTQMEQSEPKLSKEGRSLLSAQLNLVEEKRKVHRKRELRQTLFGQFNSRKVPEFRI